jgi:translation elongation factor EF-Tu-like GTPase
LAIFLDVHKVPFKEDHLKELVYSPADEFGVRHVNLCYNKEASVCFCLLEAPDREAVVKHHDKVSIQCEWISEVTMATGNQFLPQSDTNSAAQSY